jgi:hypothetical protein
MQVVPQSELWVDATVVMLDLLVFILLFCRFESAEIARSRAFNSAVCIDWDQSLVASPCGIASQHQ